LGFDTAVILILNELLIALRRVFIEQAIFNRDVTVMA
jgi:hypothetical protein